MVPMRTTEVCVSVIEIIEMVGGPRDGEIRLVVETPPEIQFAVIHPVLCQNIPIKDIPLRDVIVYSRRKTTLVYDYIGCKRASYSND